MSKERQFALKDSVCWYSLARNFDKNSKLKVCIYGIACQAYINFRSIQLPGYYILVLLSDDRQTNQYFQHWITISCFLWRCLMALLLQSVRNSIVICMDHADIVCAANAAGPTLWCVHSTPQRPTSFFISYLKVIAYKYVDEDKIKWSKWCL